MLEQPQAKDDFTPAVPPLFMQALSVVPFLRKAQRYSVVHLVKNCSSRFPSVIFLHISCAWWRSFSEVGSDREILRSAMESRQTTSGNPSSGFRHARLPAGHSAEWLANSSSSEISRTQPSITPSTTPLYGGVRVDNY
ncbi:hypothetical protein B0T21DRAFT_88362 [Apiosordaria backusii]|uniref:Uncharacterized protein n=1 Tax=Apiosordaria backusii TaxID=314023 RepID=A0AA40K3D2_9PEZI|nr:hypothetical protein B0T21DRAFT_88362 [Apiosordaria backusii]